MDKPSQASGPVDVGPRRRQQRRVGVFVCEQVSLASLGLAMDVFRMANAMPGAYRFELLRVSNDGAAVAHPDGLLTVDGDASLLFGVDLVVVPSMWTQGADAVQRNGRLVRALRDLPEHVLVVTMCTGAHMLAASGRLSGKRATTHWLLADDLQARYPAVHVDAADNLALQGSLICSGGSLAGVDACLHAVQVLTDRATARRLAAMLVTDLRRGPQSRFVPSLGLRHHADKGMRRLQDLLESRCDEPWALDDMAAQVCVSARTLQRRFRAATGMTPVQYLQAARIERSKDLLEAERLPVPEVAARVGYQDRVACGRLFKKMVGMSPAAYRQKHR
ncbi:MAG: helix-turn-helix domain-containing protein [Aquabacterium sp.]|nr:helix-turn-helix domain-containing protein [Aquabacterium sp.]